ncbi:MAG: glycosyltransferase [Acidimicrobiales bacterium]
MHTNLLNGTVPLVALVTAAVVLLALLAYPLRRTYPDDRGDGLALVLLPAPRVPSMWRAPALVGIFTILTVLYHSIQGPLRPDSLYAAAVRRLVEAVVHAPIETQPYLAKFSMGLRFLVVGSMLTLAFVGRGSASRKLLIALQAVWYVGVMIVIDAILIVTQIVAGVPVGPTTLMGDFAALVLAFVAMARMLFASYAMPRHTEVPFVSRPRFTDAVTLIAVTGAALSLSATAVLVLYRTADTQLRGALPILVPLIFVEGFIIVRTLLLSIIARLTSGPEPPIGASVPIDVIIPAWNEEECIVDTLRAIDAAAANYRNAISVVLTDDGSDDRTRALALETMRMFRFAAGRVVRGHHGGKSAALNLALAETTADLVVRIDADTIIDEKAFVFLPRWFRDPEIGLVEAMMFPRWRRSLFPHMRLFEELKQFGFIHPAMQAVDGVNVVPGVFTAFRRTVAQQLGGFTVGMNGEDGDFTLRTSRIGFRTVFDPRIVVYEDVPPTYSGIREQRIRWARATMHNQARNGPYRSGVATPKVWMTQTYQFVSHLFSPIRLMLPVFLMLTAVFEGSYRAAILIFIGIWFCFSIAFMAIEAVLAVGWGQARHFGWVLVWPLWQLCLILWSTENWLSLPGRPSGVRGAKPLAVTEAVVH